MTHTEAKREYAMLKKLKGASSAVLPCIDHFSDGGKYVMVFPFSPGDINQFLALSFPREYKLPLSSDDIYAQQSRYFLNICSVTDTIHQAGIVHSDLKLDNFVVIDDYDQLSVRAIDFGNSKESGQTFQGGTYRFNVPPQGIEAILEGSSFSIDLSHDIYGLGICCYELTTSSSPTYGNIPKGKIPECTFLNAIFSKRSFADEIFNQLRPPDLHYGLFRAMVNIDGYFRPSIQKIIRCLQNIRNGNPLIQDLERQKRAISFLPTIEHKSGRDCLINIEQNLTSFWSNKDLAAQALSSKIHYVSSFKSLQRRRHERVARQVYTTMSHPFLERRRGAYRYSPYETGLSFSVIATSEGEKIPCFYNLSKDRYTFHQVGYDFSKGCLALVTSQQKFSPHYKKQLESLKDCPHLIMPYRFIEGLHKEEVTLSSFAEESLKSWLKKPHTMANKLNVIYQISQLISFMHEKNIVFIDCPLSNCFLMPDSLSLSIKFFPLSSMKFRGELFNSLTTSINVPPEVADPSAAQADFPFDIWQLGLIMATILTGIDYYKSKDSPQHIIRAVCRQISLPEVHQLIADMFKAKEKRITISEVKARLKMILYKSSRDD